MGLGPGQRDAGAGRRDDGACRLDAAWRRGRLGGLASGIAGLLAVLAGLFISTRAGGPGAAGFHGGLLAVAGCLWLIAAAVYSLVRERPDGGAPKENAWREALRSLRLLRTDAPFRRFVIVRALLLCSALSAPYYVVLAGQGGAAGPSSLGLFIVANGLASSLSALLGLLVAAVAWLAPEVGARGWVYPLAFLVLGIAHSGVRLGRKTYVVDLAGGDRRTAYVAVSNSLIGLILLVTGLVGLLAALISVPGAIVALSLAGLVGVALARGLPEVE